MDQKEQKPCAVCKKMMFRNGGGRARWEKQKTCSPKCFHISRRGSIPWNLGKTGYVSSEGRDSMAENGRKNIAKETPRQRTARMKKMMESRNKNGRWTPPRLGKIGPECPVWIGEEATYNAKHRWIQNHWKKTGKCERCGVMTKPFGKRHFGTEWSNNSLEYKRVRSDWEELCVPCHRAKDRI